MTVEHALVLADANFDRHLAYVTASRARAMTHLFVDGAVSMLSRQTCRPLAPCLRKRSAWPSPAAEWPGRIPSAQPWITCRVPNARSGARLIQPRPRQKPIPNLIASPRRNLIMPRRQDGLKQAAPWQGHRWGQARHDCGQHAQPAPLDRRGSFFSKQCSQFLYKNGAP